MPKFIVHRVEIWIQKVEIEAANESEARFQVAAGHGEIWEDAQFSDYDGGGDWEVEEVK